MKIGFWGGRPVAGAGLVLQGLAPVPVTLDRTTGPDAEVTLSVPDLSTQAVVTILSPSHGLWSTCAPLDSDTLSLELPAVPTGDLRLAVTSPADALPSSEGRLALVTRESGFLEAGVLVNWNRSREGARSIQRDDQEETQVLEVPQVVPGVYALTWSSAPPWELAAQSCSGVLPGLGWQAVTPGAASEVRLRREARRQDS